MTLTAETPSYPRIDTLLASVHGSKSVPHGTLKSVYALIDELRDCGATDDVILIVESLSAAINKWEWALRLRDGERQADVQEHIGALEIRWAHLKSQGHASEDAPPLPGFRRRPMALKQPSTRARRRRGSSTRAHSSAVPA